MKHLIISLFLIIPALLFSQDKSAETKIDLKKEPVLSIFTDLFKLKNLSFSREQPDNSGEVLETEFQLENLTNVSMDLYIFVIATHEKEYITQSSFERPDLDDKNSIKLIQVYPDDLSNYEYIVKDESGAEKKIYQKYPKNIKAGIDKKTGKPYTLDDIITFRSRNLSKFMKKYYFFNQITILIFDTEETLLFRQSYSVKPLKR
ncbi:MAG: hypothetical protein CVV49_06315 [Spirochaetae bacterium HGW-Spirochaetae-5]|nr:MAG: hypothetical protein CVV49_06315 [Spirochaetae bacterium HGW-Spirochaetae-5]